ncbi:MAG TPA: DUF1127 domain-containing protein [Stellaceae bacterium]|nr:DUF1127 domain-containing protein [Stellaceae bacterium]
MSLINLLVSARDALVRHRQRSRAFDDLMALDDRALADIGIHRSQIPALVAGVAPVEGVDAEADPAVGPVFNCTPRLANGRPFLPPL